MELASYCSEDSFRSRIRRLCRSLVTSKSPQIHTLFHWKTSLKASCDMKNPVESSISQLEKRFWEHLLRYGRDASVEYESLEEKIEMTSVDLCLLYGAAVADRFIALLGQLMLTPNGMDDAEIVLDFLLQLDDWADVTSERCNGPMLPASYPINCSTVRSCEPPKTFGGIFPSAKDSYCSPVVVRENFFGFLQPADSTSFPEVAVSGEAEVGESLNPDIKDDFTKSFAGFLLCSSELAEAHADHLMPSTPMWSGWILSSQQLMKEARQVFVGMKSRLFLAEQNGLSFRTAGSFCVKGISDHITQYTSERAICCGNHVVYIRRFLQMPLKGNEGNTYLQFLAAMRKYLNLWATEAASCLLDTENLMEFTDVLESFIDPPVALAELCALVRPCACEKPVTGLELIQLIYDKCTDMVGCIKLLHVFLFLLEEVAKPFFAFATELALCGRFSDFNHEFGVFFDEGLSKGPSLSFWKDILRIEVAPDTFLSDVLRKVVRCGRCIQLIQLVCPFHPLLPDTTAAARAEMLSLKLCFSDDPKKYRESFEERDVRIRIRMDLAAPGEGQSGKILDILSTPEPKQLRGYEESSFNVFRPINKNPDSFTEIWNRYDQSFAVIVHQELLPVIQLQEELADIAVIRIFLDNLRIMDHINVLRDYFFLENGEFSGAFVAGIFSKAATSTLKACLDFAHLLTVFELSVAQRKGYDESILKRLSLLSSRTTAVNKSSTSYDVAEYVGLEYKLDWPLNMILTSDLINKCDAVFRRLLKVKGCTWAMNDIYFLLAPRGGNDNQVNRIFLSAYCHEIGHVVGALETHLMDVAFQESWRELESSLKDVKRFEDLRESVATYINSIHLRCLLENSKLSRFIDEMLRYAMRFYSELRRGLAFTDLQKTFHIFQRCSQSILTALAKRKGVPDTFQPAVCLTRVDFSGYFEQMSAKMENVRLGGHHFRTPYGTL